jgi:RNA polymerase sigma-70 factor (ECF subfamily)
MQTNSLSLTFTQKEIMSGPGTAKQENTTSSNVSIDPADWVDEHGDYLFRYAMMRLRNEEIAEDLVQETLLAAFQSMQNYAGTSKERTWLTSILKHKIYDYFRKKSREQTVLESDLDLSGTDVFFVREDEWNGHWNDKFAPIEWKMSPEELLEQNEFYEIIQNCIFKLPQKIASVFTLSEIEGLTCQEICDVLSLSSNNYWVIMHRARLGLRRCVELNWFKKLQ